jgi:hypothetical protein
VVRRKSQPQRHEVLEEELYKFDEAEVDRLFEQKPWRSK